MPACPYGPTLRTVLAAGVTTANVFTLVRFLSSLWAGRGLYSSAIEGGVYLGTGPNSTATIEIGQGTVLV